MTVHIIKKSIWEETGGGGGGGGGANIFLIYVYINRKRKQSTLLFYTQRTG